MNGQLTTADAAASQAVDHAVGTAQALDVAADLATQLRLAARLEQDAADALRALVVLARERGESWRAIGEAYGTSKQTAWDRFHNAMT